jgi:hypothetical protein
MPRHHDRTGNSPEILKRSYEEVLERPYLIRSGSLHQLIPKGMVLSSKEDVGSIHSQDLLDESLWYRV